MALSGQDPTNLLEKHGYEWVRSLGWGQFGRVHVVQQNGTELAAKMVVLDQLKEKDRALAQQESEILRRLRHPHIVEYHQSWIDIHDGFQVLVLVMELCLGGDLKAVITNHMKRNDQIDERSIWRWFLQLVAGLQYVHKQNVLHRDLKSSNVFITGQTGQELLKIGDFGISRVLEGTAEAAITVVGTPYYLSPEVCRSEPYREKSDMWSLGCLLYELCVLRHAFESQSLLGLIYRIISENYQPIPPCYSDELGQMVAWLLAKSPDNRPSADDVLECGPVRALLIDGSRPPAPEPQPMEKQNSEEVRPSIPRRSLCENVVSVVSCGTLPSDPAPKKQPQPPSANPPPPPGCAGTPAPGIRSPNLGGSSLDTRIEEALLQQPPALLRPSPPSLARPAPPSMGAPIRPPPSREAVSGDLRSSAFPRPPRPPAPPSAGETNKIDSEALIAQVREALVQRPRSQGNWVQAFALCDREGRGVLEVQDFVAFLESLNLGLSQNECMAVADYLSGSELGCVTLGDFHKALCAR